MTLGWLGLTDKGWFCEEPHYKGSLLHLRHNVFQAKDVIVFVHGFTGGYFNTLGEPEGLLDGPRVNRKYQFWVFRFDKAGYGYSPSLDIGTRELGGFVIHPGEEY